LNSTSVEDRSERGLNRIQTSFSSDDLDFNAMNFEDEEVHETKKVSKPKEVKTSSDRILKSEEQHKPNHGNNSSYDITPTKAINSSSSAPLEDDREVPSHGKTSSPYLNIFTPKYEELMQDIANTGRRKGNNPFTPDQERKMKEIEESVNKYKKMISGSSMSIPPSANLRDSLFVEISTSRSRVDALFSEGDSNYHFEG
jgi:hypothetical protein